MFENISKGGFNANFIDLLDFGVAAVSTESKVIAQCNFNDGLTEEKKQNTEFIVYCFNLQQRYDISKLEEAVKALELAKSELYTIHSQYGDKQNALENSFALREIEQLLKQIKK